MVDLKPCPFCGGEAELYKHPRAVCFGVICTKCKTSTGMFYSTFDKSAEDKAVELWNRRANT